jgi:hypothetical protein
LFTLVWAWDWVDARVRVGESIHVQQPVCHKTAYKEVNLLDMHKTVVAVTRLF